MGLFSLFAGPLGKLMQWIYNLGTGYFWALILFTVLTRLILFPLSIKNQKNQADRARLAPRLERIQKKYGQDRQKMMQKQQELYEKEGVKMTGGCLPMLVQMLVLFSVIAVIYKPLTYIQSIPESDINACISVLDENWDDSKKADPKYTGYYRELNLFKAIEDKPELKDEMEQAIVDTRLKAEDKDTLAKVLEKAEDKTAAEAEFRKDNAKLYDTAEKTLNTIVKTGKEFSIAGFSLLEQPWQKDLRPNGLWIIAILSGLTALLSSLLSMKYSKAAMSLEQQQAGGCTNAMMYMMPIMSLIFSFTVPAGVAVYWTFSNVLAMVQTVILNSIWNPGKIRAQAEIEYQQRRQKRREDKERLKAARLAEQAAWQEEENKAKARAKGDITQKKSAASKATPAELPNETAEEVVETAGDNEEEATNE